MHVTTIGADPEVTVNKPPSCIVNIRNVRGEIERFHNIKYIVYLGLR